MSATMQNSRLWRSKIPWLPGYRRDSIISSRERGGEIDQFKRERLRIPAVASGSKGNVCHAFAKSDLHADLVAPDQFPLMTGCMGDSPRPVGSLWRAPDRCCSPVTGLSSRSKTHFTHRRPKLPYAGDHFREAEQIPTAEVAPARSSNIQRIPCNRVRLLRSQREHNQYSG